MPTKNNRLYDMDLFLSYVKGKWPFNIIILDKAELLVLDAHHPPPLPRLEFVAFSDEADQVHFRSIWVFFNMSMEQHLTLAAKSAFYHLRNKEIH